MAGVRREAVKQIGLIALHGDAATTAALVALMKDTDQVPPAQQPGGVGGGGWACGCGVRGAGRKEVDWRRQAARAACGAWAARGASDHAGRADAGAGRAVSGRRSGEWGCGGQDIRLPAGPAT
jgi:hypothetical protein